MPEQKWYDASKGEWPEVRSFIIVLLDNNREQLIVSDSQDRSNTGIRMYTKEGEVFRVYKWRYQ